MGEQNLHIDKLISQIDSTEGLRDKGKWLSDTLKKEVHIIGGY